MTLKQLRALLNDLPLDMTTADRDLHLNEAIRALCVQAEWSRATIETATTAGVESYTMYGQYPDELEIAQPLRVRVDDVPYDPSDETTVRRIQAHELQLGSHGLWWIKPMIAGADQIQDEIALYPVPSVTGQTIEISAVVYPVELVAAADTPDSPPEFDRALIDHVRAMTATDSRERAFYEDRFNLAVEKLRRKRYSRAGRGPVQMRVAGMTY